ETIVSSRVSSLCIYWKIKEQAGVWLPSKQKNEQNVPACRTKVSICYSLYLKSILSRLPM
ncbi:hypothetical protein HMPREF1555_00623, partial [Porphyromonas gingivalis F0570]